MKTRNTFWIAVLFVLVYGLAEAQTTFGPQQVIADNKVDNPTKVNTVDLTGDGFSDIIVIAGWGDQIVLWLQNNTIGGFNNPITIASLPYSVQDMHPADVDNDGDIDIVVAYGGNLVWYENNGIGNFATAQTINSPAGARSFIIVDLDEDGNVDIIGYRCSQLEWYRGYGNGIFDAPQLIIPIPCFNHIDISVADLNGDGHKDIVTNHAYPMIWLANDGSENFSPEQIAATTPSGWKLYATTDINGDGAIDLVLGSGNAGTGDQLLFWQENDGWGNFSSPNILSDGFIYGENIGHVLTTDFDADGDTDILVAKNSDVYWSGWGDKIALLINDGTGNFTEISDLTYSNFYNNSFAVADMNNDGVNDIVAVYPAFDAIVWYQIASNYDNYYNVIINNTANEATYLASADINGDEKKDIVAITMYNSQIDCYTNYGMGNFSSPTIIYNYFLAYGDYVFDYIPSIDNLLVDDIDGNGAIDLLFIEKNVYNGEVEAGEVIFLVNDGTGVFFVQGSLDYLYAISVAIADIDNDNDIDVIFRTEENNLEWRENDGYGNMLSIHNIPYAGEVPEHLYFADLDNDNDLDLLTLSNGINWLVNDGSGNFSNTQAIETSGLSPATLQFEDINSDTFIDMILIDKVSKDIYWFQGNGNGNFTNPYLITSVTDSSLPVVYTFDVDNDGDNDIIVLMPNNKIVWHENTGNGSFGEEQAISSPDNSPKAMNIADLDGDGDLDVFAASLINDNIFWYENLYLSETDPLAPIASFTTLPAAAADTLTICQGQPVQFFNQSQNANAFLWNFGNGATSTAANPAYTYTEPGTYTTQLIAYNNLPQSSECEANAGEWEAYDLVYSVELQDDIWPVNIVNYTGNPNYTNFVLITNANTNVVMQMFTVPLTETQQQIIGEYFFYGDILPVPVNIYALSIQEGSSCNIDSIFLPENFINCCAVVNQLTHCSLFRVSAETIYNETTEEYLIDVDICTTHPYFLYYPVAVSIQAPDATWSYQLWDLDENNCTSGQINTNGISGIYNLYFSPADSLNDFLDPCSYMVEIPATAPRLVQMPDDPETRTDTASLIIVVAPGFAPLISCVSTVCQGTVADYGTNADCETYLWEVTGGQILSGQGTPAITVEWNTPPLGSISLSAGCGAETCNEPTVGAVPIIGSTVTIEGQTNFCLNEVLQYTAPYFGGTQYQWSIVPAAAGNIVSGQGSNHISIQWGSVPATLQLSYQNALLDCGGTASLSVSPNQSFSIEPALPVCEGSQSVISISSPYPFVWSVSGGSILSGQNSAAITVLWNNAGTAAVSAVPLNPDEYCNSIAQTSVVVVPYPQTPGITGNEIVCPLQTYTYAAAPLQPNTQFVWTITGGSILAGQNSPQILVQWNESGPYNLSVIRQTLTDPVCASESATLSISSLADSPFTIIGNTDACPNTSQNYQIEPVSANAVYSWSVSPPGAAVIVQGQGTPQITLLFANTGISALMLSATYCNINADVSINLAAAPQPFITQTDSLCTGNTATLLVADALGQTYTNYLWKNAAGNVLGTGSGISISTEGVYSVQVSNTWGCTAYAAHRAYQYTSPVAQILSGGLMCIESPVNIPLYAIDGTNYAFQWHLNDVPLPGAVTPFYTHTGTTTEGVFPYRVAVTDTSNGCTVLSNIKQVIQAACPGGVNPGDTILPPPMCPPVSGYGVSFTLNPDGSNCNTVTLNATTSGSITGLAVYWGEGALQPVTGTSASHVYSGAQINIYTVIVRGYFIHPVTGQECFVQSSQTYSVPLAARFDTHAACLGGEWTFQDRSYYLPTTGITQWIWDFGDGTPPLNGTQTETHAYTTPGAYTAQLTITNGTCVVSSSQTLIVSSPPDAGFSVSGGQCVGSTLQFTPDASNQAGYQWQFGDGTATAQTAPDYAYTQSGTYEVTLQVQDANGCFSETESQSITVSDVPMPMPVTATDTLFCAGLSATLTAPAGGAAYLWSSGQNTAEISVTTSGNYTVQVTLPDGCAYTSPPIGIQVLPAPYAAISPASPVYFCQGTGVTLQVPDNPAYTYTWSANNNGLNHNTFYNSSTITVTVTDTLTTCSATGSANIVVSSLPAVPTPTASALVACEGETVELSVAGTPNAEYTYHWTNGSTGTGISVAASGNYGVYAQNEYGCVSDTSYLISILFNSIPDISVFPAGCYAICEGEPIVIPQYTAETYQWYYNGNPIPEATGSSWILQAEGAYWVVMSNEPDCTITSDVLQLEFSNDCPGPLPVSLLSFTGTIQPNGNLLQWTTATEQNAAYFTLQQAADGHSFTNLAQLPAAGNSSTARNYAFLDTNPFQLTYYRLLQTDFDGTTRQAGNVITLLRPQQAQTNFAITQIAPNPTQNTATLTYAAPSTQPVTLLLHDLTGRLLFYETLQPTAGTNNFVLDMTRYPKGLYVVTLNNGETVQRTKVVKE
ncbi:hypothetical protein BVG80_00505 [Sphingobacteriales bacterium TSM_CSM]|nr:hypothetical protein BVG80_00505 [Sphingobacteriales bacterium TSM_CSM]